MRKEQPVEQESNPVLQYLDLALRKKWLILIPFLLSAVVSLYLCATLPPVYRSETTILVEPQQVPENFVQSTVTGSIQDRLNTISQQIMSRTRLETVIREFGLYPELQKQRLMEEVVSTMRGNVEIKVEERPNQGGRESSAAAFRLAFYGKEPEVVQKVTNRLAMMYIEENLKVRETQARGTKEFLEKQLQEIEQNLKAREEEIRQFKQANMGELPEQLEANLRAMDQLQSQKTSVMVSYRDAEDRQLTLERELSQTPQYLAGSGPDQNALYQQLDRKRQELTALTTRYTELYPDVLRAKKEIQELEQRIAGISNSGGDIPQESAAILNPAYTRIKNQVEANRLSLNSLQEELQNIDWKMKRLQQRVENVPKREQELVSLSRDYETIKQSYDAMSARKINAEISENLETRQKSEQFRVLDPANYPQKPVRPNRLRLLGMGLALGLGLGGGLAFATEYMDRSFKRVEDLKASFSFPVLGIIPALTTREEVLKGKIRKVAMTSFSLGFAATLVLGVHLFIMKINVLASRIAGLFL